MNLFKKKDSETKEIAVSQPKEIVANITEEKIDKYLKIMGIGATLLPAEIEVFKELALSYNLNPFKREIHVVAYGQGDNRTLAVMTGYEVYIKKAEESGLMDYWDVIEASPETPIEKYWTTFIVKRKDRAREQKWTVHYSEAFQTKKDGTPNKFWRKQPRFQTKKTAMSQGFRLFFEDVLHGIPYTIDEMPDRDERDITPGPQAIQQIITQVTEVRDEAVVNHEVVKGEVMPETAETPAGEPQIANINYFTEIIALVNKSELPPMANAEFQKGKMDYIKDAKAHMNDPELLKDLFEDLVRETSNGS